MAKYVANPVEVEAWPIKKIIPPSQYLRTVGDTSLILDDPSNEHHAVVATPEMLARMTPVVGDYYVVQSDGYVYLNPKAVFERKYRRL